LPSPPRGEDVEFGALSIEGEDIGFGAFFLEGRG